MGIVHSFVKLRGSSTVIPVAFDDEQMWHIIRRQYVHECEKKYHFAMYLYREGVIQIKPVRVGTKVYLENKYIGACNGKTLRLVEDSTMNVRLNAHVSYDGRPAHA